VTPNIEHFYIVFPVGLFLLYLLITNRRKKHPFKMHAALAAGKLHATALPWRIMAAI